MVDFGQVEQEETKNRQQFDLLTYQYATKMKELLQDVQFTLMDGMATYIKEKLNYFKSGHDLMKKLEPEMKQFTSKASSVCLILFMEELVISWSNYR